MNPHRIGLIGLGLLGSAVAERLVRAGHEVCGYDLDVARCDDLARLGGTVAADAAGVGRACSSILLSLPDSGVSSRVVHQLAGHLPRGAAVMDTTTGAPTAARSSGALLARRDCHYLETAVGGSSEVVRQGRAIVMAGGKATVLDRCSPVLRCFAREVFHTGDWGSASQTKLVTNLVLGLNRAALAEGLALAARFGLPPEQTLAVLKAGPARSAALEHKGARMVSGDFRPAAKLSQHLKDVRLILEFGGGVGARLPLSARHAEMLERAERLGFGEADNSAVIRALD